MALIGSWLLTTMAVLLAIPAVVFALEIFASFLVRWRPPVQDTNHRPRIGVIVPARDEAAGIVATLANIKAQLHRGDRLVVVADNCSDDTAKLAAAEGAEVSVRYDLTRIGKGYALDWGLRHLEQDPPDVIIVIDADCRLAPHAIFRLASCCQRSKRPVQSLYLMAAPVDSHINQQVAEFAWRVKNLVRPLGLLTMGLPCQLMGSGMAFPWATIRSVDLGSGHLVEDLKLGLDLARIGRAPIFCPSARLASTFPISAEGIKKQRQRWEHGQIELILTTAISSLLEAAVRQNISLLVLIFDLIVPPLSLLLIVAATNMLASLLLASLGGSPLAFIVSATCLALIGLATAFAWILDGRKVLPLKSLALMPAYLMGKLSQYRSALLGGRTSQWIRTDRS
jgi:cellulose synthase/poly-beta-1,6-N-acetylglucosamine synthase-like glycosyltransferase